MSHHEAAIDKLQSEIPGVMGAFTGFHDEVLKEGAISTKYKRLMLTAISIAQRCEQCLRRHMGAAISAGATREEIMETAAIGMLMAGGPAVAFTSTHVIQMLEEFGIDR